MARKQQRQKERLLRLANFIENNPELYNQNYGEDCVIGIANRLRRTKLGKRRERCVVNFKPVMAERYGLSDSEVHAIWTNQFGDVIPGFKNYGLFQPGRTASESALFLRILANR